MRLWVLLALGAPLADGVSLKGSLWGGARLSAGVDYFNPTFAAPQLTPKQFLIISSTSEKKIVYTELKNFKSTTGRTFALVDSGLTEPRGLAMDHDRGALYVADSGAKKIFRFHVYQQNVGGSLQLSTDGVQLCVSQNVNSNWVSVDINGDVFYTDASTNTINRIPVEVIEKLTTGQYAASDLMLLSEKTLESGGGATSNVALSRYVYSVYEGNVNPHVTTPGGVVSDGARLYWANTVDGTTAGVLVEGQVDPQLPQAKSGEPVPTAFPSRVLSNTSSAGYGVTKSSKYVFLSSVNEGVGVVYGVTEGGVSFDLVGGLSTPRGLVWDGDQTVFVADEAAGVVYAFPAGRLMSDAPLTKSAVLTGAFGLALMSEQDKAWPMQPFQN